ncbi:alpha/beta hydrolase [Aquamicrobium sp. LC103]|uniref:alpha/beta hydrolase n=1 Tax=Aquamicrobium sp. LC103 TaxID=1120658 RepID=UPI000AC9C335|nr:alpha/beta hydrolase [Aquamicrobium sp. LC103]
MIEAVAWLLWRFRALTLVVVLAGCGGNQAHDLISPGVVEPGTIAGKHSIFAVTTRERAEDPRQVFDGRRAENLSFARVDITIPRDHQTGRIESPRRGPRDPAKHFFASEVAIMRSEADFAQKLRGEIAARNGRALVFIHGYRTLFDGAVYRMAQIVHDSGYTGVPVLFSWASAGRTVDYIYDNNSATIGRDGLEETLRLLAANGATRIDIVAHSMGNWATMEALRQIAISDDREVTRRLGDIMLASPDIDVDVFKSQLKRIGKLDRPIAVMLSDDDRALQLSSLLAGNRPRVGDYAKAEDLASLGVVVVNVSNLQAGDRLNHAKFADNPLLVRLLGEHLQADSQLGTGDRQEISSRIGRLAQGLGQTIGTAAEIVITTPLEVINVAVGGAGG